MFGDIMQCQQVWQLPGGKRHLPRPRVRRAAPRTRAGREAEVFGEDVRKGHQMHGKTDDNVTIYTYSL